MSKYNGEDEGAVRVFLSEKASSWRKTKLRSKVASMFTTPLMAGRRGSTSSRERMLKSFTERGKATNCDSVALIGSTKVMYLALSIRLSWRV